MFIPPIDDKKEAEIIEFIRRRFPNDAGWLDGNCYWFAAILKMKFNLAAFYQPIKGHFVAGDGKRFYDWTGRVMDVDEDAPILFEELWYKDRSWAARIFHDCTE